MVGWFVVAIVQSWQVRFRGSGASNIEYIAQAFLTECFFRSREEWRA